MRRRNRFALVFALLLGPALAGEARGREGDLLVAGDSVRGNLAPGDETFDGGEYVDRYRLRVAAGQSLTLTLRSQQFDAWLQIQLPETQGGALVNDDYVEGLLDARVVHTFQQAGEYDVEVTSREAGETGAYVLFVQRGQLDAPTREPSGGRHVRQGLLEPGDRQLDRTGEFYDHYLFPAQRGDMVTVYTGAEVDAYLIVRVPGLDRLLESDDDGRGSNAYLRFQVPRDGDLEVMVTSKRPGQQGSYAVVVEGLSSPPSLELSEGRLEAGDETLIGGEFTDSFTFYAAAGERLVLTLQSADFDPYLILMPPRGGQIENDDAEHVTTWQHARLEYLAESGGEHRVLVTSHAKGETGRYELWIHRGGGPQGAGTPGATDVAEGEVLGIGSAVRGTLATGDATFDDGEYVDSYRLRIAAGDSATLTLQSVDFDAWIQLRLPAEQGGTLFNDDYDENSLDARIVHTFAQGGEYEVEVTSRAGGETGGYLLTVESGLLDAPTQEGTGPREVLRGRLEAGDRQLAQTGEYYDHYVFHARAGDQVRVSTGAQVDAYLIVDAEGLAEALEDDDGGNGHNATVSLTVPQSGDLEVIVTSSEPGQQGDYTVVVEGLSPIEGLEVLQGRLEMGDQTLAGGESYDEYSFHMEPGDAFTFTAQSVDFDSYLVVVPPEGEPVENDDADDKSTWQHARVRYQSSVSGLHRVLVTSHGEGEQGAYTLWVKRSGHAGGEVVPQQSFQGALAQGDAVLPTGEFLDRFSFRGQAGQQVVIDMDSSEFDAYLGLIPPSGEAIENDDRASGDLNARLDLTLPHTGIYRLVATSATAAETGAYRITIEGATGRVGGDASQPVASDRNYWAILVGISDYGSEQDNLENCREDAEQLGRGLYEDGVLRTNNMRMLLDGDATVDSIRAAFHEIAPQVGPRDVFLFFFSGHGLRGEYDEAATDEADRRDEWLVARGGLMRDDELNQLFGLIKCKTKVLCLDCCFAGGFGRDVISAPGRMGIFSSEEDVLSLVAEKFNAGGYLSYFFRQGLRGDADTVPAGGDGIVTAGELAEFLRARWRQLEQEDVTTETDEGARGYQNLVLDRGSVKVTEPLVRLAR